MNFLVYSVMYRVLHFLAHLSIVGHTLDLRAKNRATIVTLDFALSLGLALGEFLGLIDTYSFHK